MMATAASTADDITQGHVVSRNRGAPSVAVRLVGRGEADGMLLAAAAARL